MTDDAQIDFDDALARAFSAIEAAKKDSENPHYRSKYADLASVTEAIKNPLTAEGFSWPQTIAMEDGLIIVTQWLRRKGVAIQSVLPMPIGDKATPQQIGSAITYARRYALSAMVGVAPDDDDGEAASSNGGGKVRAPAKRQQQPKRQEKKPGGWRQNVSADVLKADERARKMLGERTRLIDALKLSPKEWEPNPAKFMASTLKVDTSGGYDSVAPRLSMEQWAALIEQLTADVTDLQMVKATMDTEAQEGAAE